MDMPQSEVVKSNPSLPSREQQLLDQKQSIAEKYQQEDNKFHGMPFHWAAVFTIIVLIAIFIGHYLTIQGQNVLNTMQQRQYIQQPQPQPQPPQAPLQRSSQQESPPQSTQRTEQALGTIATSIDGTNQNLEKLVDAVNLKFTKVQEQIVALGTKIEALPKENGEVDLTPIKSALASLSTTLSDNKNVEVIVANIRETSQRQDQALRQISTNMEALQKIVKDKSISDQLKVNSTLGEKFPPPKK